MPAEIGRFIPQLSVPSGFRLNDHVAIDYFRYAFLSMQGCLSLLFHMAIFMLTVSDMVPRMAPYIAYDPDYFHNDHGADITMSARVLAAVFVGAYTDIDKSLWLHVLALRGAVHPCSCCFATGLNVDYVFMRPPTIGRLGTRLACCAVVVIPMY